MGGWVAGSQVRASKKKQQSWGGTIGHPDLLLLYQSQDLEELAWRVSASSKHVTL